MLLQTFPEKRLLASDYWVATVSVASDTQQLFLSNFPNWNWNSILAGVATTMKVEKIEGITILTTDERLDNLDGPKLKEVAEKLAQERGLRLVLDIVKTGFIDSTGLQTLLSLRKTLTMNQGDIKIAGPTPRVLQAFELTRLNRVFEIYDCVESAMESFS